MMDHSFTKRNDRIQTTKKLDCPASFQVNKVIWMPKFKLSGALSEKYDRFRTSKLIRTKLQNGESVGEDGYIYNLPSIEKHANHFIGDSAIATEDIDSEVREYLSQLVRRGERSAAVVKKLLETFVETQLHQSNRLRRRFFPDLGTIRKIMSYEKAKLSQSPIDQERTELLIESWGGKNGKVFFRPCAREIDVLENESNKENKLLFIYQSEKMRSLYEKYGKSAIFLDATYKTTKYALPLFFIVVDTNVNYQIVGVIITQFETKQAISEGLEIFKSWNPSVNPRYGMVDNAAEEIGSLEATFPGIKVFICSFHREQAWIRWLAKKCNSNVPTNQAIIFLRKIAHAGSEEELKEAIELLESQKFYSESSLKVYFEKTWLKEIQRWATAYKPLDFHINTNNGVERMNKELKYGYLIDFKGCSLSEMIEIVVNKFLPERFGIYVEKNLKISSKQRKYDENLPAYLHEKPKWFIKLVMGKLATITSTAAQKINQTGESSFAVESILLVFEKLKMLKVLKYQDLDEMVKKLSCPSIKTQEDCLMRKCSKCCHLDIEIDTFQNSLTFVEQWRRKDVKYMFKGKEKTMKKVVKEEFEIEVKSLVEMFFNLVPPYMKHICNIMHQYTSVKDLKTNMKSDEILIHIDFSQNYECKYSKEIQSVHFGGSHQQGTLHTGVLYYKNNNDIEVQHLFFSSISESLRHDASAIAAHLNCVLNYAREKMGDLKSIQFLSDSPTTQYRNKKRFYLILKHLSKFCSTSITWNFSECGHGKGAPDGIGGYLKRIANQAVAEGLDIPSFDVFYEVL